MNVTRKDFLKASTAFAAAVGLDPAALAGMNAANPFKAEDYAALRKKLAKFYPAGFCRGKCQSKAVLASFRAILADLNACDRSGSDPMDGKLLISSGGFVTVDPSVRRSRIRLHVG